jgi:hypothetical protein
MAATPEFLPYTESHHPAPERERVRPITLLYAVFAPPIAWGGSILLTYPLISYTCYPGFVPLDDPIEGLGWAWLAAEAVYVLTLVMCASSFVLSYFVWRRTSPHTIREINLLMDIGVGRTRYVSMIGMAWSLLFFGATLFGALAPLILPLCVH